METSVAAWLLDCLVNGPRVLGVSRDLLEELPEGVSVGSGESLEEVRDEVESTDGVVVRTKLASAPGVGRKILVAVEGVRRGMLPSEVDV